MRFVTVDFKEMNEWMNVHRDVAFVDSCWKEHIAAVVLNIVFFTARQPLTRSDLSSCQNTLNTYTLISTQVKNVIAGLVSTEKYFTSHSCISKLFAFILLVDLRKKQGAYNMICISVYVHQKT